MKKILFILSLVIATSLTAFAQKPVAGAKGFTFGLQPIFTAVGPSLNSGPANTGTLLFRYYVTDKVAARVSINYSRTSSTITDTADASVGFGNESLTKEKSNTFAFQLGGQMSLGESEKLEPYIGADLFFSKSSGKYNSRTDRVAASGPAVVGDFSETDGDGTPAGLGYNGSSSTIGIAPLVGFNYYFTENFAIGAEFGWGLGRTTSDKNPVEVLTTSQTNGVVATPTTTFYNSGSNTKTTELNTTGNGMITVSIFF